MDQDQEGVVSQDPTNLNVPPDAMVVDPTQQADLVAHYNPHASLQDVVNARQAAAAAAVAGGGSSSSTPTSTSGGMPGTDGTDPASAAAAAAAAAAVAANVAFNYGQGDMVTMPQSGVSNSLLSLYHSSPNVGTSVVKSEDFISTTPNKKRKSSSSTQMYLVEQILKLYFKKSKPESKKMISMLSVKQVYLYVLRSYLHLVVPINTWGRLIRNVFEINKTIPKVKGEQVIHGWRFKGWDKIVKRDKQTLDAIKEMLNIQDLDDEYSYFKIVDLAQVKSVQVNPWPYAKSIFDVPGRSEEITEKEDVEEPGTGSIEADSIRASLKKINENMLIIGSCLEFIKTETESINAKLDGFSKQQQQQHTSYSSDQ